MFLNTSRSNNPERPEADSELMERFRRGDDDAATELYVKYADRLQRFATSSTSQQLSRQVDSEDVVQSVFRTFFRRLSEGMFSSPAGDEIWNLFLVLALNKIRQSARFHTRKKRDWRLKAQLADVPELGRDLGEAPFATLQMTIEELLDGLSDTHRRMIEMRIQNFELEEIARETCRSARTVERVLKQFRDRLSRQIQ